MSIRSQGRGGGERTRGGAINTTKSTNVHHAQKAAAKRVGNIAEYNANIQEIKTLSQELRTPGMDWSDYRQLQKYDAVELFYTLREAEGPKCSEA